MILKNKAGIIPELLEAPEVQELQAKASSFVGKELADMSDELLVLAARFGNDAARSLLILRYIDSCKAIQETLMPGSTALVSNVWDSNLIMFQAFTSAIELYTGEVKFTTYFFACYKHKLQHCMREFQNSYYRTQIVSLDEEHGSGDDTWTYHDILADASTFSNPTKEVNASLFLDDIALLPTDKFDAQTYPVAVALSQGFRFSQIAVLFGLPKIRLRRIIDDLKKYLWKRKDLRLWEKYDFKK
ncbi:MAG: hypothetical protein SPG64_02180 [Candidatus Enteromonas sp.]|nr:hypothetical protein [Candidatus Enteromonas sp.]